jgi:hypothetical protein
LILLRRGDERLLKARLGEKVKFGDDVLGTGGRISGILLPGLLVLLILPPLITLTPLFALEVLGRDKGGGGGAGEGSGGEKGD